MVTLLGFFFILANIAVLAIAMPDLIGPVRLGVPAALRNYADVSRAHPGSTIVLLLVSGCTRPWTTSTASKHGAQVPPVV